VKPGEHAGAWQSWLENSVNTGCVRAPAQSQASDVLVDIRQVEPKNRMDAILGAYRSLHAGRVLRIIFDHDPSCMYFTLQATEPEGSFAFDRIEDGPEVWRVDVRKIAR
jgi:uncharacterized protein (DUF2249 family)